MIQTYTINKFIWLLSVMYILGSYYDDSDMYGAIVLTNDSGALYHVVEVLVRR